VSGRACFLVSAALLVGPPPVLVSCAVGAGSTGSASHEAGAGDGAPSGTATGNPIEAGAAASTDDASTSDGSFDVSPDSGRSPSPDAGTPAPDTSAPAIPCTDTIAAVYTTPAGLPAMTMGARGTIVRCAPDMSLSVSDAAAAMSSEGVAGVTPTTGANLYRIEYRTYRDDGVPGASTARVYLPQAPRSWPLPVVAIAHPTEGLAPGCVPSASPTSLEDEALPWAASGFAVIASDYAGLGNEGVQGYLDNHDQAHSILDSARALRAMMGPGVFDDRVLLVGYSQGGGAVLASQGLAKSYGAGGNVVGVVVFAAEYFARLNSVQYVTTLGSPGNLTIAAGVTVPVVVATRDYAFAYNVLGADAGGATFPAASASGIEGALTSLCEVPFGGYIQGAAPHLGDIFDPTFRTSLLSCIDGDAGCSGVGSQFYQWMMNDLVPPDPGGAPVLYVQGLSDTVMPPNQEAACNIDSLQAAGVSVQVCTDAAAIHTDVVARNVPFALQWSESLLYGGGLPNCSAAGMPACTP
jgi:predicted esterase